MHASHKKLNEMNRLGDMAHFPALVNAGATANILVTITITWWLVPIAPAPSGTTVMSRSGLTYAGSAFIFAPLLWVLIVLCINLLPVVLLRLTIKPQTSYPALAEMDFIRDQHKFSDWVYLAASANMAFWVLLAWAVFSVTKTPPILAITLFVAFLATFSPVLLRGRTTE